MASFASFASASAVTSSSRDAALAHVTRSSSLVDCVTWRRTTRGGRRREEEEEEEEVRFLRVTSEVPRNRT